MATAMKHFDADIFQIRDPDRTGSANLASITVKGPHEFPCFTGIAICSKFAQNFHQFNF